MKLAMLISVCLDLACSRALVTQAMLVTSPDRRLVDRPEVEDTRSQVVTLKGESFRKSFSS